jgi:phenylacetic acid degradation operon negative regulatory protein
MSPQRNTDLLDRPLSARSLVASLLLRTRPPRMPAARLVQWCGLFGVAEGTARTALSRMVDRGELRADNGTYELAGRVGGRRSAQDWILRPKLDRWTGEWALAVVTPASRSAAERGAFRDAMRRVHMAEVRDGVWTRPANLPRAAAPDDAWEVVDGQCGWWHATPDEEPAALAATLFAPAEWARRARQLQSRVTTATARLDRSDGLAGAFVAGAAALAHLRADPLLPDALGPSGQAGTGLRAAYHEFEAAFSVALRAWFREHA